MNSFVMLRRSKWDTQEKSVYEISHSGVMLSERAACVCVCVCVCVRAPIANAQGYGMACTFVQT